MRASRQVEEHTYDDDDFRSALHVASNRGLAGTVSKLLSLGADTTLTDAVRASADADRVHAREVGRRFARPSHLLTTLLCQGGKTALELAETDEVKAAFAEHAAA